MKQFALLIIISIFFAAFTVQKNNPLKLTQLVVTIPELTTSNLQKNLEMDLNNISGVQLCETSLMTKTLMLNYDPRKVKQNEIDNVLKKWECKPNQYSYQKTKCVLTLSENIRVFVAPRSFISRSLM